MVWPHDSFASMDTDLYSIRMLATLSGEHLSGAEQLAGAGEIETLAAALARRALDHSRGRADAIRISIENIAQAQVVRGILPGLRTVQVDSFESGREVATALLHAAGVSSVAADEAMKSLCNGPAAGGGTMRGAMLVDALTGQRLEPDARRGVRVSRLGMTAETRDILEAKLDACGLNNDHVREALTLAGKVISAEGIVAELCWSDDPDYTAGYVATPRFGYVRFPHMKPLHSTLGGRAFFVSPMGNSRLQDLIRYLETTPWLACNLGAIQGTLTVGAFYESLEK